jgi:hypothetical protein
MEQPTTITELVSQWSQLLTEITDENNEQIAYKMTGALAGNDTLWDEWYDSGKEPVIPRVFDNVADLEVPDGHLVKDEADRKARWGQVSSDVSELKKKYLYHKFGLEPQTK